MQPEHEQRIRDLAQRGYAALFSLARFMKPLNDVVAESRHKRALMALATACLRESETIIFLVQGRRVWSADVLMRSVLEGSVKFAYILESPATFAARCIEFRDVLPAIAKLRWHGKAEEWLNAVGENGSREQRPYRDVLLSEQELEELRTTYPRELRNAVEGRWGFTSLLTAISKPTGAFGPIGRSLLHPYSMASHLIHMSYEGSDLPLERDSRPEERRDAIGVAHAAVLISDCLDFAHVRANAVYRFTGISPEALYAELKSQRPLRDDLSTLVREWERIEYGTTDEGSQTTSIT
jgi:hypothetical protein